MILFTETKSNKDSAAQDYKNVVTTELHNNAYEESIVISPSSKVCSYIISSGILIN